MEVYQYVTWVDDPGIPGDENYKRVTVVVRYKAPAANSVNEFVRASTLFTPGTVTITPGRDHVDDGSCVHHDRPVQHDDHDREHMPR